MVSAGVSSHGKTQVYFIEHGATITSIYYIERIIQPLIKYDIPQLFAGDMQKKWRCIKTVLLVMLQKTQFLI